MVGDDLEADIAGAQGIGMKAILVQTGKFRQEELDGSAIVPDAVIESITDLPEWLESHEDWR